MKTNFILNNLLVKSLTVWPLHWKGGVLTTRPPRKSPDALDFDCGGGYTVVYIRQKAQMCAIYYYQSSYFL